jgi:hypothetical protein
VDALLLACPTPALAAKVSISGATGEEGDVTEASFTAAPGEVNQVTVERGGRARADRGDRLRLCEHRRR